MDSIPPIHVLSFIGVSKIYKKIHNLVVAEAQNTSVFFSSDGDERTILGNLNDTVMLKNLRHNMTQNNIHKLSFQLTENTLLWFYKRYFVTSVLTKRHSSCIWSIT